MVLREFRKPIVKQRFVRGRLRHRWLPAQRNHLDLRDADRCLPQPARLEFWQPHPE
jgi:hypothetical protein